MSVSFKTYNKKTLKRKYEEKYPLYKQLVEEVKYTLNRSISRRKIRISSIESRVKLFESFYDKIVRKEIESDPFQAIEDIAGIRIICLYRLDLRKIEKLIRDKFDVIRADLLRNQAKMPFGYMSDQYVVRLPKTFRGERYDAIKSLKCEIQVRTVSMHAWATVSHHLDYKQEVDIPSELRDDFYALSGVFYIADSLFEQFRRAREESIKPLMESIKKDQFNFDVELNMDTLKAYLSWKFPKRRLYKAEKAFSTLTSRMSKAGIRSYRQLNEILDNNMDWFLKYEKKTYKKTPRTAVGVANAILRERVLKSK